MKSKLLTKIKELELFASKCEQHLDLKYPIEYLQRAKVRAFIAKDKSMIGGYVLAFEGPFRVIESLPDSVIASSPWTKSEVLDQCYEVTGLWLDKKVVSKSTNFLFWATMYRDMIFNNKKYFVYAYDLEKSYLKKLYSIVNPQVIYEGETKVMAGMKTACKESVEVASVNYIRFGIIYGWDYFAKKLVLPRGISNKYGFLTLGKYSQQLNFFNNKIPVPSEENKLV